jgi:hypothetical protein
MGKTEMTVVTFQVMAKTFRAKVKMTKVRAPLENPEERCVAMLVLKPLRRLVGVEEATEMVLKCRAAAAETPVEDAANALAMEKSRH